PLGRLLQPYGESSPMGLLWTFMGYSTSYTIFAGATEAVSGVLLFFRPAATPGAVLGATGMANIVMLDFSFDVPGKLYSAHLLLMCVFVMFPDLERLSNVLVLNRPTDSRRVARPLRKRWVSRGALALTLLFVGYALFSMVKSRLAGWRTYGGGAPQHVLYGIYDVEEFTQNGEVVPPLVSESKRWRRIVFGKSGALGIRHMDDSTRSFRTTHDLDKRTMTVATGNQSGSESVFIWTRLQDHR